MDGNRSPHTRQRVRWWDGVWVLLLAGYMLAGTPHVPFHGDESTLIFMSRDYAYQFIDRDLDPIRYDARWRNPLEQWLRLLNGTISKYAIGLAWHLGGYAVDNLNTDWDWGSDWDYNIEAGHRPAEPLLRTVRWSSALMMAASVIVLFMIGWNFGGRCIAYVASLYYALNPGLLINGQRAMMEGSFALFNLLTVLAGIWLLRHGSNWWRALLLGLFGGLALASKHPAAFTLVAVFGAVSIVWIVQAFIASQPALRFTALNLLIKSLQLVGAGVMLLLVFYLLNPAWWGDPVARAQRVLELREDLLEIQVDQFGTFDDFGDQVAAFGRQVLVAQPHYYEVPEWEDWIAEEISRYEASPWRGVSIGGTPGGAVLLLIMIGMGVWRMIRQLNAVRWLVGCWALMMVVLTLGLTPLDWQRYYLPVYPVVGLLAALGVDTFWRLLANLIPIHAVQTGAGR